MNSRLSFQLSTAGLLSYIATFEKGTVHDLRKGLIYKAICCCLVFAAYGRADTEKRFFGDVSDGSRATPVHLINIRDEQGNKILADDDVLLPFSTQQTCGTCHNYDKISTGWHFNAADPNVAPGRVGQPWILVDAATATQVPLSYRPWPGTFKPEQLGLTPWKFSLMFARQMPGGGAGELDSDNPDELMRQFVSGKLEINCLACHNAHHGQNQSKYAAQIARQNFRWAATAGCEFASVSGSAKTMPDTYDHLMPEIPDDPKQRPPTVKYRTNTFDHKNRVLFDITKRVPVQRCYFCHSNVDVDESGAQEWATGQDVHLSAGLICADCHRHGLDHNITRGYESEESASTNQLATVLSCKGCHLGKDSSPPTAGRLAAPVPQHPGIPPVHFDKLTCTACHSGPWPSQKTIRTKTARAHALGTHNANKSPNALPHITYPVFAKQAGIGAGYAAGLIGLNSDGKIAPHKLVWPAFWASLKENQVEPIALELVRPIAAKVIAADDHTASGDWPDVTTEQIAKVLGILTSKKLVDGKPAYICGGKLYSLNGKGKLTVSEHSAAAPYMWPIAHDVRPAAQSLGVRGCQDCHTTDSPFFFGQVAIDSPIVAQRASAMPMVEFEQLDPLYTWAFAFSFVFRPFLKIVTLASCVVLSALLILYGLKALACVAKAMSKQD